jgi:mRNA-degrading endonuclease RelE of RelBE toxin-antitoxin system
MSWVCELAEDARRDLREVPRAIQERVARVMMQTATDPFQRNVKALHGKEWRGVFRRRIGDYRLLFSGSR